MEIRSLALVGGLNGNVMEGYAIVFGQVSEILYDKQNKRFFTESIDARAVTPELIERSDIKMLIDHQKERMLARSRYGKGSLHLEIDDIGLKFSFEIPSHGDGQYIREMVERGDFEGCSFAFSGEETESSYNRETGLVHRNIVGIKLLHDTSIVADPAYQQTSVSIRSIEELMEENVEQRSEEKEEKEDTSYLDQINELRKKIYS